MGPTSCTEAAPAPLCAADRSTLLALARAAIESGLQGRRLHPDPNAYSERLRRPGASFVTVKVRGELNGCIGSIEPRRALVVDVAHNAYAAAFEDPRFPPMRAGDLEELSLQIALLSPLEEMAVACEEEILRSLRPGVDGLVLADGAARATFLPAVWESLPEPREFVRQLKRKAGLAPGHWSAQTRAYRYTVESIS